MHWGLFVTQSNIENKQGNLRLKSLQGKGKEKKDLVVEFEL